MTVNVKIGYTQSHNNQVFRPERILKMHPYEL